MFAQQGRYDDATAALRNAERLATALGAEDVLALTYMNQAAVAQLRRRYDQAIALAERAVALQDHIGQPHRLAESLATLGQVYVKLGRLDPADEALQRALATAPATRAPEITGAVLRHPGPDRADARRLRARRRLAHPRRRRLRRLRPADQPWYEWSVRGDPRPAQRASGPSRRGAGAGRRDRRRRRRAAGRAARRRADRRRGAAARRTHRRGRDAHRRRRRPHRPARPRPGPGASSCGCAASSTPARARPNEAYHDIAQSASVFDLVGERYQAAVSQFALGRLAQDAGARSIAERHLTDAARRLPHRSARRATSTRAERALAEPVGAGSGIYLGSPADADDALVQRLVNASVLPDLLAHELAMAVREAVLADVAVVAVTPPGGDLRVVAFAGGDVGAARRVVTLGRRRRRLRRPCRSWSGRSGTTPTGRAS